MDAKINEQKYGEKRDIYIVSKYLPTKCLLRTKGKITNCTVEEADTTIIKRSKLTSPVLR